MQDDASLYDIYTDYAGQYFNLDVGLNKHVLHLCNIYGDT